MTSKINYNDRQFKSVRNSPNGDVSGDTTFHYHQEEISSGRIITAVVLCAAV